MSGNTQDQPALTTPESVAKSNKAYDRMVSGKTQDVTAELHKVHGTKPKRG